MIRMYEATEIVWAVFSLLFDDSLNYYNLISVGAHGWGDYYYYYYCVLSECVCVCVVPS